VIASPTPSDSKSADHSTTNKNHKKSSFLTDLAAHSRGNPSVAWAIWRHSLRRGPEKEKAEKEAADTASKEATTHNQHTIWVTPWQRVSLPHLHGLNSHRELFVLQTLLLHSKLSLEILVKLLPFSAFEVEQTANYLKNVGVLEINQECWQVTAVGYPAIREALANAGYPLDCL
jgi:hypothetical protein